MCKKAVEHHETSGRGKNKKPHYFITAGHSKTDCGALGCGLAEADLTMELRDLVILELRKWTSSVSNDDDFCSLHEVVDWINEKSCENDIILDIHFNAYENERVGGTEVFIPTRFNSVERDISDSLAQGVSEVLEINNRGVKLEGESQHRTLAIMSPIGNNLLLEVCFITNKDDMKKYKERKELLATRIAKEVYRG